MLFFTNDYMCVYALVLATHAQILLNYHLSDQELITHHQFRF